MAQLPNHWGIKPLLQTVFLAAIALVFNLLIPIELFFGVNLILGSVAAIFALLAISASSSILIGVTAAAATWWLWGHPYATLSMSLEILIVSYLYRRGMEVIWADLLYWLCLGAPLVLVCYHWGIGLNFSSSGMIALKQAINGLLNATLATLFFILLRRYLGRDYLIQMRQLIFSYLSFAILLAGLIPVMWLNAEQKKLLEENLANKLIGDVTSLERMGLGNTNHSFTLWQLNTEREITPVIDISLNEGTLTPGPQTTQLWQPNDIASKMKRWQQSWLVLPVNLPRKKQQFVVTPINPVVEPLSHFRAISFLVLFGLIVIGLIISRWFANQLTDMTTNLLARSQHLVKKGRASRLEHQGNFWLKEFQTLDDTLVEVSSALTENQELQLATNQQLELQVEERTQELHQSLSLISAVLDAASEFSIIASDLTGIITVFNIGAERMLGYSRNELIDRQTPAILHKPDEVMARAKELSDTLNKPIEGFRTFVEIPELQGYESRQWTYIHKDGHELQVQLVVTAIRNENNAIIGYLGIARDVTLQLKAEMDRNRAEAALIDAKEQAEQAASAKGDFLASMSHEIRTPMNGVLGMLNLIAREPLSTQQTRHLNLAQSSADSLLNLINDILDFSKIDAGKLELETVDFDPRECIEDIASSVALRAEEKHLEVLVDVANINLSQVRGDPNRFKQILFNLMGNAIKFTDAGEITISGAIEKSDHNGIVFRGAVIDTGIGIPHDRQAHLFDSFTQVDASTTRKYGGTGLGLSIVKRLCQLMNGDISLKSESGQGSQFEFTVHFANSPEAQLLVPTVDSQQPRIMIAENNPKSADIMARQLKRWGCDVTLFKEGDNRCEVDLILVDQKLIESEYSTLKTELQKDHLALIPHVLMSRVSANNPSWVCGIHFQHQFPKPARTEDLLASLALISTVHSRNAQNKKSPLHTKPLNATRFSQAKDSRLLLVEDNAINQEVALGLMEDLGLETEVVNNGQEAIERLSAEGLPAIHLILMDCQMPILDGYEATRSIRQGLAGSHNQQIPIIAMTANAMKGDKEKCLNAGMNDYLSKPLDEDNVIETLKNWGVLIEQRHQPIAHQPSQLTDNGSIRWDQSRALKRVKGKTQRLEKLAQMFVNNTPEYVQQIEQGLADHNSEQVAFAAHALKGSAGNLSLEQLLEITQELEAAAKTDDLELCRALFTEFNAEYQPVIELLSDYKG